LLNDKYKYYIYCNSGIRSVIGYGILKRNGFNVVNVRDGI